MAIRTFLLMIKKYVSMWFAYDKIFAWVKKCRIF